MKKKNVSHVITSNVTGQGSVNLESGIYEEGIYTIVATPVLRNYVKSCKVNNVEVFLPYEFTLSEDIQIDTEFALVEDDLIYDRTEEDIRNKTPKAYYNVEDLNRIEKHCANLIRVLKEELKVEVILDVRESYWKFNFLPFIEEFERIRLNVETLRSVISAKTIEPFERVNYEKANELERCLQEVYNYIERFKKEFMCPFADMYYANEPLYINSERSN